MSPSENSTTITCSTTSRRKHSRRCHKETSKSVGNNRVEHSLVCEQTTSELIKSVRPANMQRMGHQTASEEAKEPEGQREQQKQQEKYRPRADSRDSVGEDNLPPQQPTGCWGPFNAERNKQSNKDAEKKPTEQRAEAENDYDVNVSGNGTVNIETKRRDRSSKETVLPAASAISTDADSVENNNNHPHHQLNIKNDSREEDNSTPETVINNKSEPGDLSSRSEDDDAVDGRDVVEWARRKKRKVQTQLNRDEEKGQRTVIRHQQSINRSDDIMKVANGGGGGVNASSTNNNTKGSWTVTVAGCYHPNMAPPDLQMRLSFPGARNANEVPPGTHPAPMNWNEPMAVPKLPRHPSLAYEEVTVPELDLGHGSGGEAEEEENDDGDERQDDATMMRQVLPVIDVVPRKSLMRAPLDDCM